MLATRAERRAGATTDRRSLALAAGVLFVVTVAAVDPRGLVPTGPLRWTAIAVTTGIAAALLVARRIRLDRTTGVLWLALAVWLLLATATASDTLHAWIGTPDRRLGYLGWLTFPLLFVVGQQFGRRTERVIVLRGAAIAATALGVWCCFELGGYSLIGATFAGSRVGGPFGQPAYLGAAATLLLPLCAGLAADRDEPAPWRVVAASGAAGALVALLASQTRGAWAAIVAAAIVVVMSRPGRAKAAWQPLALGAAALVVLFALTPLGARFGSAFDLDDGTARGRLDDWRVATRVVAHDPVTGVGPEGYRIAFAREVDAAYVAKYGAEVIPDRAHNGVLDVAAIGGLPAGALYGALIIVLLLRAGRAARRADPVAIALGAAVVAYVVQQMFLFPLHEIDPMFWMVAGMLVAVTSSPDERGAVAPSALLRAAVVVVATVTAYAAVMGGREVLADRALERAAAAPGRTGLADADRATNLRPDSIRTWYVAARIAARGEALTDVDDAIARVAAGLRRSHRDPALRREHARLLVERARRSELEDDRRLAAHIVADYRRDAPHDPVYLAAAAVLEDVEKP